MTADTTVDSLDFFVSYTQQDVAWAEWIAWQLQEAGYIVQMQTRDMPVGTRFAHGMHKAIQAAAQIIALLSPAYLESEFSGLEWRSAVVADPSGEKRRLIPIRVQPCEPSGLLAELVYFDLFDIDSEEAGRRLLEHIRPHPPKRERSPLFPGRRPPRFPAEPIRAERGRQSAPINAVVVGMDGGMLDRQAVNYVRTSVDDRLREDLANHHGYGVVQLAGAPGQGKTWTLSQLGLDAQGSYEICYVDMDSAGPRTRDATDALSTVVHELGRAQHRCYRTIERNLQAGRRPWASGPVPPGQLASIVEDQLRDARLLTAQARQRLELVAEHVAGMQSTPPRLPHRHERSDGIDDALVTGTIAWADDDYAEDHLAGDISLLVVLGDARALTAAARASAAVCPPPQRALLLFDGPHRLHDAPRLMALLRGLHPLATHYPALRRALVVVSKAERSPGRAVHASALSRWHRLDPFDRRELATLVAALTTARWLLDGWDQGEIVARCIALGGGNRRVCSLYLDHCHNEGTLCSLRTYVDDGLGDSRLPGVVSSWVERALAALSSVERGIAGDVEQWLQDVCAQIDAGDDEPVDIQAPPPERVRTFARDFGLANGMWVPVVQQLVCREILAAGR